MPQEIRVNKGNLQSIHVQATADVDAIRTEEFNGTDHMVVPLVALVEGVIWSANAENPELALASEFGKQPLGWNGRPVTLGHPKRNGQFVSASQSPAVFEEETLGFLFNTVLDGDKLKTEAWINIERVSEAGEDVQKEIDRISSGDMVEISTGLFAVREESKGSYQGESYDGVWREVLPDHLAILREGDIGACSVEDGCGIPRLNYKYAKNLEDDCHCGGACDDCKEEDMPQANEEDKKDAEELQGAVKFLDNIKNRFQGSFKFKTNTELSDRDTRAAIYAALEHEDDCAWFEIIALFNESFVYTNFWEGKLYQREYSIGEEGVISLSDSKTQVRPVTEFVPVTIEEEDTDMSVQEKVDALISNESTQYSEDDRQWLSTLSENQLDKMTPKANEEGEEEEGSADEGTEEGNADEGTDEETEGEANDESPAANTATPEDFIKGAPKEMQDMLSSGLKMHQEKKAKLVKELRGNERCEYSEKELKSMELGDLERLAKLANVPSYVGNAGGNSTSKNNESDEIPTAPLAIVPKSATGN